MHIDGIVDIDVRVLTSGIGGEPLRLYAWLRLLVTEGKPGPTVGELAEAVQAHERTVRRWMAQLEAVGLVYGRWRQGGRDIHLSAVPEARVKKWCGACRRRPALGRWCARCRQTERSDRTWWLAAKRLALAARKLGREPSPFLIAAALEHRGIPCPVWDYSTSTSELRLRGLVSRLLDEKMLKDPEEWQERRRAASAGGDDG